MKFLGCIVVLCVGSWGLVSLLFLPGAVAETFLGMIVPLLLAVGTTLLVAFVVTLVSYMPARRIAEMNPTDALRGTHA